MPDPNVPQDPPWLQIVKAAQAAQAAAASKQKEVTPMPTTVPQPATDPQPPQMTSSVPVIDWTKSSAIRYVFGTWLAGLLLQLGPMLQNHNIDFWSLGSQAVVALGAILLRMFSSDVNAPFATMNKNNLDKK